MPMNRRELIQSQGLGAEWKEDLTKPGDWTAYFEAYGENEKKMAKDMQATAEELLNVCGLKDVKGFNYSSAPGSNIHEMGTARMGNDSKASILNKWNQSHDISNLFITDGSCMVSSPCQNPSLTYMALTARACNYAVKELKKNGKI